MTQFKILMSLALFAASAPAFALSHHTSVDPKDCVVAESSELDKEHEIDHKASECPGLGGYRIFVAGGDVRYSITLGFGQKQMELTKVGAFHDVGSKKIEWVYERPQRKDDEFSEDIAQVKYLALIHRISFPKQPDDDKWTSRLYVTKLAGENSCVVGVVEASDKMNDKATAMGLKAQSMECLKDKEKLEEE